MNAKEFEQGWRHFCDCINFGSSALDADAIQFMNEMPHQVHEVFENTSDLRKTLLRAKFQLESSQTALLQHSDKYSALTTANVQVHTEILQVIQTVKT